MPQIIGNTVIQNPNRNYFGAALGQAAGQAAGQVFGAVGRLVENAISPDPKLEVYQNQVDAERSNRFNQAMNNWQAGLQSGAWTDTPENRLAFAKANHLDEEGQGAFSGMANPTVQTEQFQQANQTIRGLSPIGAAGAGAGPSAATEQVAVEQEARTATIAPVIQQDQSSTTPAAPPIVTKPAPVLSPAEEANRRAQAALQFQRIKGNLAQLGQLAVAAKTGVVDAGQNAMAASLVASTERDINSLIDIGGGLQGIDIEPGKPGTNYADLAFKFRAYQDVNNPLAAEALARTDKAKFDKYKSWAQDWENSIGNLSPRELDYVVKLSNSVAPSQMGNAAFANYFLGKLHQDTAREQVRNNYSVAQSELALKSRQLDQADKDLASVVGLRDAQIAGMTIDQKTKLAELGPRIAEYRLRVQGMSQALEQENQMFGYKLSKAQIENISAVQSLVNQDVDDALKLVGLDIGAEQRQMQYLEAGIERGQMNLAKLRQANDSEIRMVQPAIDAYNADPKKLAADYRKLDPTTQQKVQDTAVALSDSGSPSNADLAEAMAAVHNPNYGAYLSQRNSVEKLINTNHLRLEKMAAKDQGVATRLAQAMQAMGKDPAAAKQQRDEILNQFLNQNVIHTSRQIALSNVQNKPTDQAVNFLQANPQYISALLGNTKAVNGKIVTQSAEPNLALAMFRLARRTQGKPFTLDQFKAFTLPGRDGAPSQPMSKILGNNLQEAYNNYRVFAEAGY